LIRVEDIISVNRAGTDSTSMPHSRMPTESRGLRSLIAEKVDAGVDVYMENKDHDLR
jgi:hypothetical protein